jgi:hypothetical protein
MLDKVAVWGLRLVAAVIFVSGLLALASIATTGRIGISPTGRGHGVTTYSGAHALGIALLILGIGGAALYASVPPPVRRSWWRISAFVVVAIGALIIGTSMLLGA